MDPRGRSRARVEVKSKAIEESFAAFRKFAGFDAVAREGATGAERAAFGGER